MTEIVISSFLSVIFDKLASATLETLAPYLEIKSDIRKLELSLLQIRNVLTDASQKEITDQSVKRWLTSLQHVAYDIDDVLDEIATEAMRCELTDESETHVSKVRKLFSNPFSKYSLWTKTMKDKVNDITTKLHDLIEEKDALCLIMVKEETGNTSKNINRRLQTSLVHSSSIVGRHAEKEELLHKLLGVESCDQNFSIVPIVGMGGIGKTTLARLLYDEKQVKDHFELKAWVCVSDEFDSFAISKVIFQSVAGVNKDFADLNLLQVALRDHLKEKKFLLVLDDVWSESCEDWETLVSPFHACALGSKVIMTTRKDKLLKKLGYSNLNQIGSLSHDVALSLLALHALGVNNFDSHLSLKPHGEGIVKKCDGLPLALKALGRLLSTKRNEEEDWKIVLDSELWRLPLKDEILPALILSYHDLSAPLKQLFAYCSLFPKDCLLDKEELVQLWMAEGFLHKSTQSNSTEECLGHEYFDQLLSRSFFQHAPNNESFFVMHDMMNDLAKSIAGELFKRLEKDIKKEALENYRHMSFVREEYVTYKKFEPIKRAKSLRTILATSVGEVESCQQFYISNKILVDLVNELSLLRVLCLSKFQLREVPESIGTLKHLRYLNLSQTKIEHLPENVSNLYNLQTLILFGCDFLANLPDSFLKLKNLRYFDVRDTPLLKKMPLGLGELKGLQTLSKLFIRVEGGNEINKLKDFKNLFGKISIVDLDKVHNATHVREANIAQKRLSELELVWSDVLDGSSNEILEKEVMIELKPPSECLKQLEIVSYGGLEFPIWVGDPSFHRLKHVSIRGCKNCASLPPLGQLHSLKELSIKGLDRVKVVGLELLGESVAFHSLEILCFEDMQGWENWSTSTGIVSFPYLHKLIIKDCPNLVEVSLEALPSLNILEIDGCDSGVLRKIVEVPSVVTKLDISHISGLNDVVWRGVLEYLRVVEELSIQWCNGIRYLWESEEVASKILVKLGNLNVSHCDNLVSLGEKEGKDDNCTCNLLTSLRMLKVYHCKNMERCNCPDSIEMLKVDDCSSITTISLPTWKLKLLTIRHCDKLLKREWGGQKMNNNNTAMLEYVSINDWPNLKSVIELNYLVHLTQLIIAHCESLECFPENELPNLISIKRLHIIDCPKLDVFRFWPPKLQILKMGKLKKPVSEWGPTNFPTSLVRLELVDDGVSRCSQFSHLLPSSLTSLSITGFKNLESVSTGLQHLTSLQYLTFFNCHSLNILSPPQNLTSLQHLHFYNCPNLNILSPPQNLTSLQHLYFCNCPNMMHLPELLIPSLLSLKIWYNCPNLEERCSEKGCYGPLVSYIPCFEIG